MLNYSKKDIKIKDEYKIEPRVSLGRKPIDTKLIDGVLYMKCNCCGSYKPLNDKYFYKKSKNSDSFKAKCIDCIKKYYQTNRERRLAYQNNYAHNRLGVIPRSNKSFNK